VSEPAIVEIAPPDLSAYRAGNTGIPYVTSLAAAAPGPHAVLLALTHGNEICGAIALDRLLRENIRPARGTLTFAFANVAAYSRFDPAAPHSWRCVDEDFNRLWDARTLDGPRHSIELDRARELRPLIERADYLLDIHSMTIASEPLMLAGLMDKSVALARRLGAPSIIMRDAGHAAGTRLRDYGRFADSALPAASLLIECGEHWRKETADAAYDIARRFLAAAGIVDMPVPPAEPQRVLDVTDAVTVLGDNFSFVREFRGLEIVREAGTVIAHDGGRPVATPYHDCVLVMPSPLPVPGSTAVRFGRFL